jgi:hypothetical protein
MNSFNINIPKVCQSSEQAPFASEIVGSILATDSPVWLEEFVNALPKVVIRKSKSDLLCNSLCMKIPVFTSLYFHVVYYP